MKFKSLIAILAALTLISVCFTACGGNETEGAAEDTVSQSQEQNDVSEKEETTETPSTTEKKTQKVSPSKWVTAYKRILNGKCSENGQAAGKFALLNIDTDDIPELLIAEGDSHTSQVKVYTYNGKEAVDCGNYGSFGSAAYSENKIVGVFTSGGGGTTHSVTVGEVRNGKYHLLWEGMQSCADGAPFEFYSGEKMISQDEFKKSFNEYVPDSLKSIEFSGTYFSDYISLFPDLYGCKNVECSKSEKEFIDITVENIRAISYN